MTDISKERIDELFSEALTVPPEERRSLLDARCAGNTGLRSAVDDLLRLAFQPAPALEPGSLVHSAFLRSALEASLAERELAPGQIVGAWRVVREVGRGGMGTVYLVERADANFRQRGALKLVRSLAGADDIARRLHLERRILASLTHPHIARLLDGGQTEDGRPYFVMEFVEGRPIDQFCDAARLTVDARLDLFGRVCRAVEHAHRQLVVHRDVKPSNIVVTADGDVKLLDFGIARLLSSADAPDGDTATRSPMRALTPEYASPEQVRGDPVVIASDVYQLGLVLYELITGSRAQTIGEPSPGALVRAVCETEPARPSACIPPAADAIAAARRSTPAALARKLRGDLDGIILCALCKEPDRRYASVGELVADLQRYRSGLPVRARRGRWTYRAGKFLTRHRVMAGWTAATLVAAAMVLPAWMGQRWRATREAERAEQIERVIGDLFAFASPRVQPAPPLAVTYLDHATHLVRTELRGQAPSQARLLTLLGRVYNALGHYESSIGVLAEALTIRRTHAGAASLETAETLEWLGQSQHYSGQYGPAEVSVREAFSIRRTGLGSGHPDTIRTAIELGDLLHTRGALVEAEQTLRAAVGALRGEAFAARAADLGHDSLPRAIRDLANVLRDRGLLDESAAHYREAISLFRQLHGDPNQQVATSQAYFSRLLIMRAEFAEAESLLAGSIPTLRRVYDGEHPLVAAALRELAFLRIEQGRFAEADALLGDAQRIQRQWLGSEHSMVARASAHQAELARKRGRLPDAVSLARQTLAALERHGMGEHPSAIDARTTLGEALAALGDREAAVRELTAGLAAGERQYVDGDARIQRLRHALWRVIDGRSAPSLPSVTRPGT
ncbi:MAG: protein kinase domain-containing protein [Vicinamibacterales bacterium]